MRRLFKAVIKASIVALVVLNVLVAGLFICISASLIVPLIALLQIGGWVER